MSTVALLLLLPEVVLLSTFPFIFYWFARPLSNSSGNVIVARVIVGVMCVMGYLFMCAMYFVFSFGSGMSGGAGPYPLQRLLQTVYQAPVLVPLLPAAAVLLAKLKKGTLGLWVFAMGAGFISFWAGLGWLPSTEMDWRFVIAFAIIGGLCGMAAGYIVSRVSELRGSPSKVLLWSLVGSSSAAIGVLASWSGVQQAMPRSTSSQSIPIEVTPFSIDPGVMLPLLLTVVILWLFLSTIVALATGYIRLHRGLRTDSEASTTRQ